MTVAQIGDVLGASRTTIDRALNRQPATSPARAAHQRRPHRNQSARNGSRLVSVQISFGCGFWVGLSSVSRQAYQVLVDVIQKRPLTGEVI